MKKKTKSSSAKRSVTSKSSKKSWWSKLPFMTKLSAIGIALLGLALLVAVPFLSQEKELVSSRSKAAGKYDACTPATRTKQTCGKGWVSEVQNRKEQDGTLTVTGYTCCKLADQGGGQGGGGDEGGGDGAPAPGDGTGGGGSAPCPGGGMMTGGGDCVGGGSGGSGGGKVNDGSGGGGGEKESLLDKVLPKLKTEDQKTTFCTVAEDIVAETGLPESGSEFKQALKERKADLGSVWSKVLTFRNGGKLLKWYDQYCQAPEPTPTP